MKKYLQEKLKEKYLEAIEGSIVVDEYINDYVDYISGEIVRTTLKFDELNSINSKSHSETDRNTLSIPFDKYFGEMVLSQKDKQNRILLADKLETVMNDFFMLVPIVLASAYAYENSYELSEDRAKLIAENESNSLYNYDDMQQAMLLGCTKKTWHTILDSHTRFTHEIVDGTTIPIKEPFVVGNSEMLYPKDTSLGASASEIVNCRCSLTYSKN